MTSENPERALALSYAPAAARPGLEALLALDAALAQVLRSMREPVLGQMRLTWWRDRLIALDDAPPPGEPVLQGLADHVLPTGIAGAELVPIVEGWHVLIEAERLSEEALRRYAVGRGALFPLAGRLLGACASDPLEAAGQGWALADLARNLASDAEAAEARALAAAALRDAASRRWSRPARALGALAHLARLDLDVARERPVPHGAPARVGRLLWHRLTGR